MKIAAAKRSRRSAKSFASEKNSIELADERSVFYLGITLFFGRSPDRAKWYESGCMLRQIKYEENID